MLNFLGRDSPPTIPNSSKLAARFQPDTRKCTEVQSTLSIRECNPSFNRVYVTSREDPSSPPLRGLPRSGRKNDCSSEVSSFLSLSNSAAGQPRDTVESLERKGKERKGKGKKKTNVFPDEKIEMIVTAYNLSEFYIALRLYANAIPRCRGSCREYSLIMSTCLHGSTLPSRLISTPLMRDLMKCI